MVETPVKTLRDLSLLAENMLEIGKYLGMSEEECGHRKFAEWYIEELKNYETSSLLRMQINLKRRIKEDEAKNPLVKITEILVGVDNANDKL